MRKPKISTKYPFDYDKMVKDGKYMYIATRCGNSGGETRPRVVMEEKNGKMQGFTIDIFNDGIEQGGEFSAPKFTVNPESLTLDINQGIIDWLVSVDSEELVK